MDIRKRLLDWCPKPKRPVSTHFIRLAIPLYIFVLIGGLVVTAYVAVASLPPLLFSKTDESGWVPREIERINFPGGAIVVRHIQYGPFNKGYISIHIEAQLTSEEALSAYVDSRTNALNMLFNSISPDFMIEAAVTFKAPLEPAEFASLYEASLVKFSDYAVIVTDEETGTKGMEIFCHQTLGTEFTENLAHIKEGYRLNGIIGVDALIKAEATRLLQSDSRVLLIDPKGDPIANEVAEKYRSMSFSVEVLGPAYIDMWGQYVRLKHGVAWVSSYPAPSSQPYEEYASINPLTVNELLANSLKYDGKVVHVFGRVSDLGHLEGAFFKLDGTLLVCYIHNNVNLQSQISEVQNGDPMIVTGVFNHESTRVYADNIRPSKFP